MKTMIRMDEYCSSVRDGTHDTPKPKENGKFLVTSKAINNNTIDFSACYYISNDDFIKINKRSEVNQWDVIMTMIGTVGRLHITKEIPDYAIKNIALFKIGDEYRAKWLYYYLSTNTVQNYFELIASGTSQHFIGLGHLRKLRVADWNHSSKTIVDILSAYDSLIEANNKRIKILEQMAENLYKEWFVRFRFPGHETTKFENGLPKGWECCPFSSQVEIFSGGTPSTEHPEYYEGDIPFYTPKDSTDSFFTFETITKISENGLSHCNSKLYPEDTIMITARGTVGNTNLLAVPMAMNQSCYALQGKTYGVQYYLYLALKNEIIKFKKIASGGVFDTIIVSTFDHLKFIVPKQDIMISFNGEIAPFMKEIKLLMFKNINLTKQRDLLLPRLMSGKLEV